MNSTDLRSLLIVPVFLYVAALGFYSFAGWDPVVLLVVIAMALPVLEFLLPRSGGRWFAPAWLLAGLTGLGLTITNGAPTGIWADIGAGVLLGTPITALAGLLLWRKSRLSYLIGVEAGLAVLLILVAAINYLNSLSLSATSANWLLAFSGVNTLQFDALLRWVQGNTTGAAPPLAVVTDPVFIALAVLALLSVVLALLERPAHSGRGPVPWDPQFSRSSGIASIVVAAFAGLTFEWTAAAAPDYALLVVAVGVALALGTIAVLVAFTRRRRDVPTGPPPPAPGS